MQLGSICTGGTTCGDDRNLLDFIDATIDDHGRVEVGFADGCIDACVTAGAPTPARRYPTIARQSSGRPLFSAFDPVTTNLRLTSTSVSRTSTGFSAKSVVKNTGTKPLSGVRVQLTDNGKQVFLSTASSLAPGRSRTVTTTWKVPAGGTS